MKPQHQPTHEELQRELEEKLASGYYFRRKPAPVPVLTVPISEKVAAAAESNPDSVRVAARTEFGEHVVEGPRRNANNVTVRVDHVTEVDGAGRPVWGVARVVSDYNPFDALKRD
jgi:hypothetical protein